MAKLYFRYGAMGSSKTANAVMVQYNYRERGQQVLMLKSRLENRDGATIVRSRCGLEAQCRFVEELPELCLDGIACVIVDEAHFLTSAQVRMLVDIVDERDIPVICYGLRTDFRLQPLIVAQLLRLYAQLLIHFLVKPIAFLCRLFIELLQLRFRQSNHLRNRLL